MILAGPGDPWRRHGVGVTAIVQTTLAWSALAVAGVPFAGSAALMLMGSASLSSGPDSSCSGGRLALLER